jgi:hypothetical protein
MDPEELKASHDRYVWKQIHTLDRLHEELASLYRTRSTDRKRIDLMWRVIQEKEMQLRLDGVEVG